MRKFLRSLADKDIYPQLAALEFTGLMDAIEAAERVGGALQLTRKDKARGYRPANSGAVKNNPSKGNSGKDTRKCHHCNRPGHIARYCPKRK